MRLQKQDAFQSSGSSQFSACTELITWVPWFKRITRRSLPQILPLQILIAMSVMCLQESSQLKVGDTVLCETYTFSCVVQCKKLTAYRQNTLTSLLMSWHPLSLTKWTSVDNSKKLRICTIKFLFNLIAPLLGLRIF